MKRQGNGKMYCMYVQQPNSFNQDSFPNVFLLLRQRLLFVTPITLLCRGSL